MLRFLMHRVELKGFYCDWNDTLYSSVPNAPCGVESRARLAGERVRVWEVPNAPCGVESSVVLLPKQIGKVFLMHRVELKAKTSKVPAC